MLLHVTKYILTTKIAQALLWTLMHSLWQGILIALIAALLINSTRKSVAALRYKLLGSLLCGFIIISVVTFCYEINLPSANDVSIQSTILISNNAVYIHANKPINNFISEACLYIQLYKNYAVLVWMIIVVLKCITMIAGIHNVYRLKHSQVADAGIFWNNKLQELAKQLGITKPVIFLKSAIAEIPMTAGHLKPFILFPAAAFTNMPVENIEAILLHELAHIRRNDYLLNMLQSFVEIIFFFNPALLWFSSLIKEERENCCDDIALDQTKNKKQFIHALLAFKEQEIFVQQAVLFSGRRNQLLNRLKRIITNKTKTVNTMEKTFLSAGIIITVFATVAFTKIKQPLFSPVNHTVQPVITGLFKQANDTVPATTNNNDTRTVISHSFNGKHYKLIEINGKKELYINDIKVPDNKISDYKEVMAKLEQQIVTDKKNQEDQIAVQAEALAAQAESIKENDIAMEDQSNIEKLDDLKAMIDDSVKSDLSNAKINALKDEAENLQAQASQMKANIKNVPSAQQRENLKAEAIALQQQAVVMKAAMKNQSAQMKKEALKAQAEYMKQQDIMNKAQLDKQMEQLKTEQKKLSEQSEVMKQQQLQMKAEMDKQAEIMKQQQIQMKVNIDKQNEQLKEQHEELIKQIKRERDSVMVAEPIKPNN